MNKCKQFHLAFRVHQGGICNKLNKLKTNLYKEKFLLLLLNLGLKRQASMMLRFNLEILDQIKNHQKIKKEILHSKSKVNSEFLVH